MFAMIESEARGEGRWVVERGRLGRGRLGRGGPGRGKHGRRRHGGGKRHGRDGDDDTRAGRVLAQGDLSLIMLALIAPQPRHGYEIIKLIEETTQGWYSPSPGIVYPTLTYLDETGYLTGRAEGAKKLYTITEEGRIHLEENREFVDTVLKRLAAAGERFGRTQRQSGSERDDERHGPRLPRLVRAALENLRDVAAERVKDDAEAEVKVVDVLARAAAELRRA